MAYKRERLEKEIERYLATIILSEVKDERIRFVTVTNVNLTSDLSIATIYYTVFGSKDQIENSSRVLNDAKGYIRTLLAKRLQIRKTPDLIFKYDNSLEEGSKIEKILAEIKAKENNNK